ncbi:protein DELAY OF GERMINATION 1 [Citrus sinensis]|nr:protein DELAY OF GERMINATION 1 [Citrus sinensis]
MASSHKLRSRCCFNEWMHVQEQELNELLHAQTLTTKTENSENLCIRLTKKIIKNYEEYMEKRSQLFHDEASGFFAPRWCSSLENSSHWMGGCRPSSFIRLLYAQSGSKVTVNS